MHLFVLGTRDMTRAPLVNDLPDGWYATGASWSPDGRTIAYTVADRGVYTVNPDGSDRRQLFTAPASRTRWSPDGTSLAVTLQLDPCPWFCDTAIGVVTVAGGSVRILARVTYEESMFVDSPVWSPDGTTIGYTRSDCSRGWDPRPQDAMVAASAGGESRLLLANAELLGWWP